MVLIVGVPQRVLRAAPPVGLVTRQNHERKRPSSDSDSAERKARSEVFIWEAARKNTQLSIYTATSPDSCHPLSKEISCSGVTVKCKEKATKKDKELLTAIVSGTTGIRYRPLRDATQKHLLAAGGGSIWARRTEAWGDGAGVGGGSNQEMIAGC